ncbi:uncharacterized protein METZ01_LOCUS109928 [marine metagenome]|uniref:Uncharacterized protein n=1 Tax=marine metagenome TaxID=408172 RepID=A0A381WX38_9ZZZZ
MAKRLAKIGERNLNTPRHLAKPHKAQRHKKNTFTRANNNEMKKV